MRRFDGPTIEAALAKVHAELGSDARITSAEKVRQGGFGGFFARERVEIAVEVDDSPATGGSDGRSSDQSHRQFATKAAPASILDLADSVSDEEHETTSFAAVLERIAAEADVAMAAQTAIEPPPAPVFPAPAPAVPTPAPAPAPMAETAPPAAAPAPVPAPMSSPVPARPARPLVAARATAAVPRHVGQLQRLGLPGDLLPYDAAHGLHCALVDALAGLPAAPALPAGKGTVLAIVGERAAATAVARDLALDMRLDPEEIVFCSPKRKSRSRDSWLELSTVDDADEHRRSWRWRLQPTVVVVDAPPVARGRSWGREILSVLEPTSAWGVVDATRKLEDVASWSDELGGLDAFAVTNLADTVSPATVLHLGVPVGLLDGEPASPELWADVLMERLAA